MHLLRSVCKSLHFPCFHAIRASYQQQVHVQNHIKLYNLQNSLSVFTIARCCSTFCTVRARQLNNLQIALKISYELFQPYVIFQTECQMLKPFGKKKINRKKRIPRVSFQKQNLSTGKRQNNSFCNSLLLSVNREHPCGLIISRRMK